MSEANIFFIITSGAVVVVSISLVIALVYIIQILKDVKYIVHKTRHESDLLIKDVHSIRESVKKESYKFLDIIGSIVRFVGGKRQKNKKINT
jgi:uncharacterized protein YoxC